MTAHDDVPKMTVAKLRDALKKKGLDTAGLKAASSSVCRRLCGRTGE